MERGSAERFPASADFGRGLDPFGGRTAEDFPYIPAAIVQEFDRRDCEFTTARHGWPNPFYRFVQTQTARALLDSFHREREFPLEEKRILDAGCGRGGWLLEFARWGADPAELAGIDLNPRRIAQARRRLPLARLHEGDAKNIPWPDAEFDIVAQFTLFSSVLSSAVRREVASEMLRVLRPGGLIIWYDLRVNNPANGKVRPVGAREIRVLFPGCAVRLQSLTLAPPLARRIVPVSWMLALALEKLPFLRTHYLALIRKPHDVRYAAARTPARR